MVSLPQQLAECGRLLVVSDFDGTIAPLTGNTFSPQPNMLSVAALEKLARLAGTTVAVLSGRDLATLSTVTDFSPAIVLAGSHGAETTSIDSPVTAEQRDRVHRAAEALEHLAAGVAGCFVERKPFQACLHVRKVTDTAVAQTLMSRAVDTGAAMDGIHTTVGSCIVELSASSITKGDWITRQRTATGADRVVFLGDDTTDEAGFAVLTETDLGVKVGPGATAATARVADVDEVGVFLTLLADRRAAHTAL
ncbi:trehalose-phosphatase [Corynebacterium mendelii]|uniref:Trehalose 6-phosphate phosphatase n=1 Tax=Corynebacterium mendelii TaxID=2765362 RepID=A0A939E166_9CORY|nr:trehalose-phosphatase [Corynebacterium mendelii]MBN9645069.1 trehalose-phosphatase [Corynebacterium mendelii]